MYDELRNLSDDFKLNNIYKNNLYSIKSICEYLGTWNDYPDSQKFELENLTFIDSNINRHFNFQGKYNLDLTYGEITRKGVETIISKVLKYKKDINASDVFVDVGSGCGKLILHCAVKLPIQTFVGIEIMKDRNQYAKKISEQVLPIDEKKVFFINKDLRLFDFSIAKIVFCNNLCFSKDLNNFLFKNIPYGCHVILTKPMDFRIFKESFTAEVSWIDQPFALHYYIK